MPESNLHLGDEEIGGCQNHSHYHNVFPQYYNLFFFPCGKISISKNGMPVLLFSSVLCILASNPQEELFHLIYELLAHLMVCLRSSP